MAFLVEDGTGTVADATSYTTVQEWKDYWVDRGFDFSAYTDTDIEVALIKATAYIELQYRSRFLGYRLLTTQALSFPRVGIYIDCVPQEGVPLYLKYATFEYAKRTLAEDFELLPDPAESDSTGMIIQESKVQVGPIRRDTVYASVGAETTIRYPAADKWLYDFITSYGGVIRA